MFFVVWGKADPNVECRQLLLSRALKERLKSIQRVMPFIETRISLSSKFAIRVHNFVDEIDTNDRCVCRFCIHTDSFFSHSSTLGCIWVVFHSCEKGS